LNSEDRALADVASSVADGVPVDWEAADVQVPPRQQRLVRHLRLVENISQLYRTLPDEDVQVSAPADDRPHVEHWGPLVLLERIGQGTSGEVYRAWDSRLHRDVALKLLHHDHRARRDAQERVLGEARRLARIRHEHVVSVYGAEEHEGRMGLWMELVRGESLEERIKAHGPLPADEAARIGRQLCAALSAVHAAGLIHRDVKAQNVILEASGRTVLMDFGTGEELRQSAGSTRLAGTPLYLAPELFKAQPASVQSDLYSLGVLLFYLVTGQFPVTAGSVSELARAHIEGKRRELDDLRADLPAPFVVAVERALSPNPAHRQRTAAELELALRDLESPPETLTLPSSRWPWRVLVPVAAALMLVITALIVWTGTRGGGSAPMPSRVAVLPFVYASGSSEAPFVADALTDQLIATLGQVDSLRVTASDSVGRFTNTTQSPAQIAAALGVDAVLQPTAALVAEGGSDRQAIRVDAKLFAAGTGELLWTKSFTSELGSIDSLYASIAREAARNVRAAVSTGASRRLGTTQVTTQRVTESYFEGLYHLKQLSPDHARLAIAAFERALALDPEYAPALVGLARSYIDLGIKGAITHAEARARATVRIERALALDSESSEARVLTGDLKFYYNWDWRGAEEEYLRAIEFNGSSDRAITQYARYLAAAGRLDSALEYARRGRLVNPLSSSAASTEALVELFRRDYAAALRAADEALALNPGSAGVRIIRSRVLAAANSLPEAIDAAQEAITLSTVPAPGWRAHLISLQARVGQPQEARGAMRRLVVELERNKESMGPEHLAYIHLGLSDFETSLAMLEQAADERSVDILWLAVDPRVDELRGNLRFKRVLERVTGR
jgi:serine/threonine-protein kinase